MSNPILEGMARASYEKATSRNSKQMPADYFLEAPDYRAAWQEEMRAALLFLADNVSDEMVTAGLQGFIKPPRDGVASDSGSAVCVRGALIAALRQAAGGEG